MLPLQHAVQVTYGLALRVLDDVGVVTSRSTSSWASIRTPPGASSPWSSGASPPGGHRAYIRRINRGRLAHTGADHRAHVRGLRDPPTRCPGRGRPPRTEPRREAPLQPEHVRNRLPVQNAGDTDVCLFIEPYGDPLQHDPRLRSGRRQRREAEVRAPEPRRLGRLLNLQGPV